MGVVEPLMFRQRDQADWIPLDRQRARTSDYDGLSDRLFRPKSSVHLSPRPELYEARYDACLLGSGCCISLPTTSTVSLQDAISLPNRSCNQPSTPDVRLADELSSLAGIIETSRHTQLNQYPVV